METMNVIINEAEIDEIFSEYAQYKRIKEEAEKQMDICKGRLQEHMKALGEEELIGKEHKCTYKEVKGTTFDKKGICSALAEFLSSDMKTVMGMYTHPNPSMRFNFD